MLTVSDLNRVLADCGDGIEVKADGNTLLTAQVEGTDPRFLNLVSQPAGVRLPEGTTQPPAPEVRTLFTAFLRDAGYVVRDAGDGGTAEPTPNPGTAEPAPAGDDQDGSADLV